MGTQLKWATWHDFRVVLSVLCCHTGSYGEFMSFIHTQILNSSYALKSNFQTTSYMALHHGTESSQKKKKSKAKQNKKTEKRKRKERNLSKQRPQRVLLKTIPNENEMKNKYKTKLKNVHYLTPTVFWLTILTYENFQLTTFDTHTKSWGYSGLKQTSISDADTLGFVMWTCLAEGSLLVCAEQEIQALFYPCSSSAFT